MLRVGIMLDSHVSSAWIGSAIEAIRSSGFAVVDLTIIGHSARTTENDRSFSLIKLYEQWDYRRNRDQQDAFATTDLSSVLAGVPEISFSQESDRITGQIVKRDLTEIRVLDLDVLLCLGSNGNEDELADVARYGVWSFHFGNDGDIAGSQPLLRELIERDSTSRSSLRVSKPDGVRIIYESQASTDHSSLYRNRNLVYWKTSEFALRCLRELDRRGPDYLNSFPILIEAKAPSHKNNSPTDLQIVRYMATQFSSAVQARFASRNTVNRSKWYLAIRKRNERLVFDDPSGYQLIVSPGDRFYADPFLVEKDGKTFLFYEDFRYVDDRAVISCSELGSDGTFGPPVEVLRRPYHLSYPFVFEDEGQMYMIPECRGNRTVELYRATNFPTQWTLETVLMSDVNVVDATIQKLGQRFWMFAGVSNGKYSCCDELCLFFADSIKGPWTPHPNNPLISDVRRARPAGALFYDGGRLIRPSQDCSKSYGYGLVFSEVVTINETDYEERLIGRVDPFTSQGHEGTHTYTQSEKFEVVDRFLAPKYARVNQDI